MIVDMEFAQCFKSSADSACMSDETDCYTLSHNSRMDRLECAESAEGLWSQHRTQPDCFTWSYHSVVVIVVWSGARASLCCLQSRPPSAIPRR